METTKFKTTIKCAGCIATVTPFLNNTVGANNWEVDTQTPEKVLTITWFEKPNEAAVIAALSQAGHKADRLH